MSGTYYNEWDLYAAEWLRNLIAAGHIAPGDVDTRSIVDVRPDDLRGYVQAHFFAGIGGWSLAARLAGWPDDRPLWTGSCPCQPFSLAGAGLGEADERHLWPELFRLVRACRPNVLFGEQVAAAVGKAWLDGVCADLESVGYAVGAIVVPACAVNAPHRRDRLWFVADRDGSGRQRCGSIKQTGRIAQSSNRSSHVADGAAPGRGRTAGCAEHRDSVASVRSGPAEPGRCGVTSDVADGESVRGQVDSNTQRCITRGGAGEFARLGLARAGDVGHCHCEGSPILPREPGDARTQLPTVVGTGRGGFWDDAEWIAGVDGKARRVGTDFRRLVDGFPAGMAGLRSEFYSEAIKEVIHYGAQTASRPTEVLRAVWNRILSEPTTNGTMGESPGVSSEEILLAFVRELHRRSGEGDPSFSSEEELRAAMRSMRQQTAPARASRGRQREQQRTREHSDSLQALSRILAQHAETMWSAYRQTHAAPLALLTRGADLPYSRIGALKGFGNAIVPQVAAEVIAAYMDCRP